MEDIFLGSTWKPNKSDSLRPCPSGRRVARRILACQELDKEVKRTKLLAIAVWAAKEPQICNFTATKGISELRRP